MQSWMNTHAAKILKDWMLKKQRNGVGSINNNVINT
jgi:hypothetical protein